PAPWGGELPTLAIRFASRLRDRHRTRALNFTVPVCPGGTGPGISNRTTTDPASFGTVVTFAGRSDCADPATYSSRPLRLSLSTRSDTGESVPLRNRMVNVTSSPTCTGPAGSTSLVTTSSLTLVISSGSTALDTTRTPDADATSCGAETPTKVCTPSTLTIRAARSRDTNPTGLSRLATASGGT